MARRHHYIITLVIVMILATALGTKLNYPDADNDGKENNGDEDGNHGNLSSEDINATIEMMYLFSS